MVVLVSTRTATTSPICVIMKKILEFKQSGTSLPLPMASQLLMVLEELCAAKASLQRPCQDQILTTKQLFDFVSKEIRGIHFVYATLHEYEEELANVASWFQLASWVQLANTALALLANVVLLSRMVKLGQHWDNLIHVLRNWCDRNGVMNMNVNALVNVVMNMNVNALVNVVTNMNASDVHVFVYRWCLPSTSSIMSIAQNLTFVPVSIMLAYFFRGVGRYRNGMYCEFLESLSAARGLGTGLGPREAESTGIGHYDFEMSVYPVTFSHAESDLRFIAAHVVARRMIYPGSLMILQLAVEEELAVWSCRGGAGSVGLERRSWQCGVGEEELAVWGWRGGAGSVGLERRRWQCGVGEEELAGVGLERRCWQCGVGEEELAVWGCRGGAGSVELERRSWQCGVGEEELAVWGYGGGAGSVELERRSWQCGYNPHRAKLLATDGNHIDCIFIDRRGSSDSDPNNSKLVICCEGNAAFYEAGMIGIPLSAGYSVIGWNHPGFGESTGLPFPSQEASAIDVVVRYAATKLGFALDDIIMYGWSIGGFTCSCAAASYPDIGAVIIDASFEELSPLVERAVHPLLAPFSRGMVAEFFDLNIAEQLCRYPGPIKIIRRGQDEMMSQYPLLTADEALVRALHIWLSAKSEAEIKSVIVSLGINLSHCAGLLKSYLTQHGPNYPWTIGEGMSLKQKQELLVYLAGQYLVTVDESGHNELLPQEYFTIPNSSNL
eukprot:Em0016g652a